MTADSTPPGKKAARPKGQQYRHVYVPQAADPARDSQPFRVRLREYVIGEKGLGYSATVSLLRLRLGLEFPTAEEAFRELPIETVLSFVTLVVKEFIRLAHKAHADGRRYGHLYAQQANEFIDFVRTALQDEHLAYEVDDGGGVHPLIDAEFQANKSAAIAALAGSRYENVGAMLKSAFDSFTVADPNTKDAVRDVFDAAESLFKLIIAPRSTDLTASSVKTALLPMLEQHYKAAHGDAATISAALRVCNSFGKWADACHPYRHGQGSEAPVAPPIELAVVLVSQGASFIRWLADVDRRRSTQ